MMKMNFTDNQSALGYAIYMIVGSYFKKAKCTHPILETNMRIRYVEQKLDNQYHMEEACISYVEHHLLSELPAQIWEDEVQVRMAICQDDGKTEIHFISPMFVLIVKGEYKGRKSFLSHKLWIKNSLGECRYGRAS